MKPNARLPAKSRNFRRYYVWFLALLTLVPLTVWVQAQTASQIHAVRADVIELRRDTRVALPPRLAKQPIKRLNQTLQALTRAERFAARDKPTPARRQLNQARRRMVGYIHALSHLRPHVTGPLIAQAERIVARLDRLLDGGGNSAPVADAGPDQTISIGNTVSLDGSGSSDADGDALTFAWRIVSRPAGSAAELSDPTVVAPSVTVDESGSYVFELIVNDGIQDSAADTVTLSTQNSAPMADAGPDQSVFVGDTVQLDGGASQDADGDALTYRWSLSERPAGSTATLSDPSRALPTFVVDLSGTYVAELIVNDGSEDSALDSVTVTTQNSAPVADAGPDQSAFVGDTITLDGSASTDVDGDGLHYAWFLTAIPDGSTAVLSDPAAINPSFDIDLPGTYVVQLTVNDGALDSAPDSVMVSTENSAPVANAGPDQTVFVGDTVQLDGELSEDADGDPLTYLWSLTSVPDGSTASLSDFTAEAPTFDIDLPGAYIAQLIVNDGELDSAPDPIMVSTENSRPVADAGPDQAAGVGDTVVLDGGASSDADGDPLTFDWSLLSAPATSTAVLTDADTAEVSLVPDLAGDYVIQLIVNDGTLDSAPDTALVTVTVPNQPPTITSTPVTTGTIGIAYGYTVEATDPDGGTLSYSLPQAPAGMVIDAVSGVIDWLPNAAGDFDVTVEVQDGQGGNALQSYTITVSAPNQAPQITSAPITTATVGEVYSYPVTATDPDGDPLVYSLTVAPAGMDVDPAGEITWTPDTAGDANVTVRVEDGRGGRDSQSYVITVVEPVLPPVITSTPNTTATVDGLYQYPVSVDNPQGGALAFALTTAPVGLRLDPTGGQITWTPVVAGAFPVAFTVTNAAGLSDTQAYTLTVDHDPGDLPPGLGSIGDLIAPLGSTLRVQLTANDPEGATITYMATPLPLPQGMELNIVTGEFEYTPSINQIGSFDITFSAGDGRFTASETVTITVPAPDPAAPTSFSGRVLDANSMADGFTVPVVGATMSFLGIAVSAVTDAAGNFILTDIPATAEVFSIDGDTAQAAPDGAAYASFREQVSLVANVDNIVARPFSMPRIDATSLTPVDPLTTTVVNNPDLGVTLTVSPNTAMNGDGSPFTGQLSISEVPRGLAPAALPEFFDPALLITIQPAGVVFNQPVPITFPNTDKQLATAETEIWSVDPDRGEFTVVGTGRVTNDGQHVETIAGGIRAADWHFQIGPGINPDPGKQQDEDKPCPGCPMGKGSSTFSLHDGHMATRFSLPTYRSLETSRGLSFSYRTFRAYPVPVVEFDGFLPFQADVPPYISSQLEVGGLDQGTETFFSAEDFNGFLNEPFHTVAAVRGEAFSSGMYTYRLKVTNNFRRATFDLMNFTLRSTFVEGEVMIINEQASPFGSGWMLEGLYKLVLNGSGSVTLISPDGNSINYRPGATPDVFQSPDSDFATFVRNPNGSYTHTEKNGIRMHFDADGLLTAQIDRNGNTIAYTYDTEAHVASITDPVGLVTNFTYGPGGKLALVSDPANRTSRFEYNAAGDLIKITYPDGTFEAYEYDMRHLMTAHEDERGNRSTDRYDNFGRVIDGTLPDGTVRAVSGKTSDGLVDLELGIGSRENPVPVTRPDDVDSDYVDGRGNPSSKRLDPHGRATMEIDEVGRVTEHVRDADSNPTQTTRPIGSVVTRAFDDLGNVLTQREEFNGATTTYAYDPFSLVTSVTNPRDHTTTINRDPANGNPLSAVNHLGHTTTMEYDSRGLVTRMVSPNNLVTAYTYNAEGLMATKTETPPAGSPGNVRVWTYAYFPTGLLQQVVTPDNITLTYAYDERSYLISVTDNLDQSITYTYDEHKNVVKTETTTSDGSLALLVDSVYDTRNRLIETRAPHVGVEESITKRFLDNNSNLVGLMDPNGNNSSNAYDPFNRLAENTHRLDGVTAYTYDDQDRIVKVIAPNGVVTDYEYDIINRRTKEISPDRGTLTYTYDLANNVTEITEGRGITANMTYDDLERVSTKTFPNTIPGKDEGVTYTYDACAFGLGYLCERIDESGAYAYEYDAFGNMTAMDFTEIEGITYPMGYVYDDGEHITQMTMPSGRVVDYARDGVRRVDAIDTELNGAPQSIVSGIQYRGDNQMLQCTFGNGLVDDRQYDLQGRLTQQLLTDGLSQIIDDRSYTYDKNSNILNIDTNVEDNAYQYDALDRLVDDAIDAGTPNTYAYDLNDNRLTEQLADLSVDELYDYNLGSNQLREQDALSQEMTPQLVLPDRELVYNDASRLFQLIEDGELKASYIYNDEGQRTRKVIHDPAGGPDVIVIYHYDHMGYLITETDEAGNLIRDYIWTEGMHPVAQIDSDGVTESLIYLHTDHLMTNRLATDETQAVVWRWEGEAFGETPAEEIGGVEVNLRFPGQYFDGETGLHYNHFRYYDHKLGRYITSDPIGLDGGLNSYNYSFANPIKFFDLQGKSVSDIICFIKYPPRPGRKRGHNDFISGLAYSAGRDSCDNCNDCQAPYYWISEKPGHGSSTFYYKWIIWNQSNDSNCCCIPRRDEGPTPPTGGTPIP